MVSETEPLLGKSGSSNPPEGPFSKPIASVSPRSLSRSVFSSDPDTVLDTAANDVYEALLDDSDYENEQNHDEDAMWLREQRSFNKTLHWFKRPSVGMMVFCIFIFSFSGTIAEASKQMLFFKLACNYLAQFSPTGTCDPIQNQVLVSNLELGLTTGLSVVTLAATSQIGHLTDKYGRKPFIVLIALSTLASRLIRYIFVLNLPILRYWLMIVVETSSWLFGGPLVIMTLANCYVSDIVEAHERIFYLGFGIAAFFLGLSSGPVVGNFITSFSDKYGDIPHASSKEDLDIPDKVWELINYIISLVLAMVEHVFRVILGRDGEVSISEVSRESAISPMVLITKKDLLPLRAEIVLLVAFLVFAVFILPELRLVQARRKSTSLSRSLSISLTRIYLESPTWRNWFASGLSVLRPLRILMLPEDVVVSSKRALIKRDRRVVMTMVAIDCAITAMAMSILPVLILYGVYTFKWESRDLSILIAVSCMSRAVVLLLLLPIINHRILQKGFGFKTDKDHLDRVEHSMALLGMVVESIGLVAMAVCSSSFVFITIAGLTAFSSLIGPSLNSAIIKYYPELKIGEVFGATALLKNIINLVGPFAFLTIYKKSIMLWNFPSLVIYILAVILAICAVTMVWLGGYLREKRPEDAEQRRSFSYVDLHRSNSFVYQQRQK